MEKVVLAPFELESLVRNQISSFMDPSTTGYCAQKIERRQNTSGT